MLWLSLFVLVCTHSVTTAADLSHTDVRSVDQVTENGELAWVIPAVCATLIVCMVLILIGCADFCQREPGFKDFNNEDAFAPDIVTPTSYQGAEFTMLPPVENTPDHVISQVPVVFEPLPDVASQRRQQQRHQANTLQLRPKVAVATRERAESEDDLDDVIQRDNVQDKVQLQTLLTNRRNQLPRSQLQYIKELGSGWFGKVLQGEGQNILPGHKKTKIVIQMLKEESDPHDQLAFLQEASPYREVDHSNVLRMLGQCVDSSPFLTVLDFCPFGDLKAYLRSHRVAQESFNEKGLLLKFACEMAAGLQALHQQHFIHRDFAIRNCMLASDLAVKVGDYGLAEDAYKEDYYTDRNGDVIPIRWLPPESLLYSEEGVLLRSVTKQSNIWSYGVAIWEVITFGAMPYSDLSNEHVLRLVVKEGSVKLNKPDVNLFHLDRVYQLMELCWAEPMRRPSLRELRIMLLHLLSRKDDPDTTVFNQKWNMLMPRKPPAVVPVQTFHPRTGTGPSPHQGNSQAARPSGFDSDFSSMIAQAGSFDPGMEQQSLPGVHGYSKEGNVAGNHVTSEKNEFTLEAEVNYEGLHRKPATVSTPANELSLDQELFALGESGGFKNAADDGGVRQDASPLSLGTPDTVDVIEKMETKSQTEDNTSELSSLDLREMEPEVDGESGGPLAQSTPHKEDFPRFEFRNDLPVDQNDSLLITSPAPDMASTPKNDDLTDDTAPYLTTTQGELETSQSNMAYQTAQQSSDRSLGHSLSSESNERSLLGQDKFAAMLQTVAMSYDGEDSLSTSCGSLGYGKAYSDDVEQRDSDQQTTESKEGSEVKLDDPSGIEEIEDEATFIGSAEDGTGEVEEEFLLESNDAPLQKDLIDVEAECKGSDEDPPAAKLNGEATLLTVSDHQLNTTAQENQE